MSSRYDVALVATLKLWVSPTLTLICVAKPWRLGSPAPVTLQAELGLPALLFSQAIGFTSGEHGSATAAEAPPTTATPAKRSAATAAVTSLDELKIRTYPPGARPVYRTGSAA